MTRLKARSNSQVKKLKDFLLFLISKRVPNILNLLHNFSPLTSPVLFNLGRVLDVAGDQEKKDLRHPSNLHSFLIFYF